MAELRFALCVRYSLPVSHPYATTAQPAAYLSTSSPPEEESGLLMAARERACPSRPEREPTDGRHAAEDSCRPP